MKEQFNITPTIEHQTFVVDAGGLDEKFF